MDKMNLDLDDLTVDSFTPQDDAASRSGTVHGQQHIEPIKTAEYCGDTLDGCNDSGGFYCDGNTDGLGTLCVASCGGTCIEDGCGIETELACLQV